MWLTPPATLTPFTENKSNLRKTYIITKLSIPPAKLYIRLAKFPNVNPTRIIVDSNLRIPLDANVLKLENNDKCIVATTTNCDIHKKEQLINMGIDIIETTPLDNKVDLKELMIKFGEKDIDSILLEGGGNLNFSMLQNKLVDKVMCFIAPKIIGGDKSKTPVEGAGIEKMNDAININNIEVKNIDNDILISGDLR